VSQLPEFPVSYWIASVPETDFPALEADDEADVVVVGGGITGITAAYLLSKAGKRVIVLEAGRVLNGTTGHTTAKITAQHDLIYDELIQHFGEDKAKLYYEANREALSFIRKTASELDVSCDLAEDTAYLYAQSDAGVAKLEREHEAYRRLGIPGSLSDRIAIPLEAKASLAMERQARFHPMPYLRALIDRIVAAGSRLFEKTTVMKVEDGDVPVVLTDRGHRISCRHVVSASHFPFADWKGFYFARLHAERSYVLGVRIGQEYEGGMYLGVDQPSRSIRIVRDEKQPLVLIGGEGHKAGQSPCTIDRYETLREFAESLYPVKEIAYRWSTQDLVSLDKLPYIGRINAASNRIWVATGYRKWGMTNGTAAAILLTNAILGEKEPYGELFDPVRMHADPDIKTFVKENVDVAKQLIAGKLELVHRHPDDIAAGEGAVVRFRGKRAGAYREADGTLHLVDTTCTHLGCETYWNDGDRTWDCPCHGSRFSYTGDVVEGPAKKPLASLSEE